MNIVEMKKQVVHSNFFVVRHLLVFLCRLSDHSFCKCMDDLCIFFWICCVVVRVSGTVNGVEFDGFRSGSVDVAAHFIRYEAVVITVDEEDRDFGVFDGFHRAGCIQIELSVEHSAKADQRIDKFDRHSHVGAEYLFDDVARGIIRTVSDDSFYIRRKVH